MLRQIGGAVESTHRHLGKRLDDGQLPVLRALRLVGKEPPRRAVPASGNGRVALYEVTGEEIKGLLSRAPRVLPLGESGVSALAGLDALDVMAAGPGRLGDVGEVFRR